MTMGQTSILIRQAGPYMVTTDGERLLVNGQHATPQSPPSGSSLKWLLDTGVTGSNGKRDVVGLTEAQYQIHLDAVAAHRAAVLARPKTLRAQRADLSAALADLRETAYQAEHDAIEQLRTTGRTQPAADRSAEIALAQQALADFDAAHPEVKAEIAAEHASELAANPAARWAD